MLELHISSTSSCLKKPWVASHPPFIPQPLPAAFHGRPFSPSLKAAPRSRIYAAASSCKHVCHAASAVEATQPSLQPFLQWLVANGTEGVGTEASKIALYSTETGERGVIAVAPIKRGEVIAKVPLRLAITDSPDDEESNALEHAGAPWSVQIACKLLRMRAEGDACPWKPYIDVLPASVPAPAASFSWDERQRVAYEPMLKQMDTAVWFASDAWARLPSNAAGPSPSRASFEWALSVVHSRTFGLAAIGGGVGVRLLMPLIDMLNHAGDVALAPFGAADPHAQACDNVRWDVVTKLGGEQVMVMSATKAIEANEELLLSYGERANDDFFLFYGFCPPRNPHDHVELFTSIEDAIDWHLKRYIPKATLNPNQLQEAITAAYSAAAAKDPSTDASFTATLDNLSATDADNARAEAASMKLLSGGRVDARLAAAILALHTSARVAGGPVDPHPARHVQEAVAARSAEILRSMHSTCQVALIEDLRELAAWEERDGSAQHVFVQALRHYEPLIACSEVAAFVHSVSTGERKIAMKETSEADVVVDAGASADDELYRLLRQTGGSAGGLEGGDDVKCMEEPSSGPSMLSVIYRAYKCMILWDAVLAAVS